jgi:hypothetical protein
MGTKTITGLTGKRIAALKSRKKVIIRLEMVELERFFNDVFGTTDFDFVNDQEPTATFEFKVTGSKGNERYVRSLQEGNPESHSTGPLLNYLAAQGLIEKGTYVINH